MKMNWMCRSKMVLAIGLSCMIGSGCSDMTGSAKIPAGIPDPKTLNNEDGAIKIYQGIVAAFEPSKLVYASTGTTTTNSYWRGAFIGALIVSGTLADELQSAIIGGPLLAYTSGQRSTFLVDARQLPEQGFRQAQVEDVYAGLQAVRSRTDLGIATLRKYAPNSPPILQGHLYVLAGYAEVLLADLFCSGIPLSTVDFEADYTYRAGSSTAAVYEHAITRFDSALLLTTDSARIQNLARVGKGRALLALGRYDEAAQAVAGVPDEFRYSMTTDFGDGKVATSSLFQSVMTSGVSVSNRKGGVGIAYITGGDSRTAADSAGINTYKKPWYFPRKYGTRTSVSQVSLADGVEARLIRAEAALRAGRNTEWLEELNRLRAEAVGAGLAPLEDPGTFDGRVDLLFHERAAWLFLTAHRLGDLRRLIRTYQRTPDDLFPRGEYPVASIFPIYGTDVTFPIPGFEQANPQFTGCLNRDA